jgi:hypothetical protein
MTDRIAVFDIDGTVADISHRRNLLEVEGPARWTDFFAAAGKDAPIPDGVQAVRALARDLQIVWLTGRPERLRVLTEDWLREHELPRGRLIMHPDGLDASSVVVKTTQVQELARDHEITRIVDDDPRVVHALRAAGFPAEQAPWSKWRPSRGQCLPQPTATPSSSPEATTD